jgi:dihydrofolate synthase/folylpolyglutamate synthase
MGVDHNYRNALSRLLEVPSSPRLGLERMEGLLDALGNPHHRLRVLHVAGTNGKGSVAAMLESMLRASGHRTGLTTSPHLCAATERIRLDGAPVARAVFVDLEQRVFDAAATLDDPPTFFERVIAMAFAGFAEAAVDVAVVEVGLGGRLDATNVVSPLGCAITPIGLDHQQFLGDTLEAIAGEKAGILKPGVPAVIAEMAPSATDVIKAAGERVGAPLRVVGEQLLIGDTEEGYVLRHARRSLVEPFTLSMGGFHQVQNAAVAVGLLDALDLGDERTRREGLEATAWPGRFEVIEDGGVTFVLDGAHNPASAGALARALATDERTRRRPILAVIGATRGHDPAPFAAALGRPERAWATKARAPRSVDAAEVLDGLTRAGWRKAASAPCEEALDAAREAAGSEGVVLVTGSLYLVGEVRARLLGLHEDPLLPLF